MSSLISRSNTCDLREQLESKYQLKLCKPNQIKPLPGLCTGYQELDQFLPWSGLPANGLSLFLGRKGQGATQLWLDAARTCLDAQQWVAWVNADGIQLNPAPLIHKKINLAHLLSIRADQNRTSWFWLMEELLSLSLFQMIGAQLPNQKLKSGQLQKLRLLSRRYQVSLVLFGSYCPQFLSSQFDLILRFHRSNVVVERSRFRPSFHLLRRKLDENSVLKIQSTHFANIG